MKVIASFYVSAYSSYSFLVNGLESQDKGWQIGAATLVNQPLSYPLETIPHSDFGSERVRKCYTTRSNKIDWCLERTGTNITAKVVAKVGAIRQIEKLNESSEIVTFAKLEVLRDACVKLEEPLATKIVKRGKLTCPGSQTVSELSPVGCTGRSRRTRIAKRGKCRLQIVRTAGKNNSVCIAAARALAKHVRVVECVVSTW